MAALPPDDRLLARRLRSFAAASMAIATTVMVVVSLLLWLAGGLQPLPVSFGRTAIGVAGLVVAPLGYAALGVVLAHHLPRNPIGWLFLLAGFALGTMLPVNLLVASAHETLRPAGPALVAVAWLRNTFATPVVVTVLIVAATLFPTGRPPTARWRCAVWLTLIGGALLALSAATDPEGLLSYPSIPSPTAVGRDLAIVVAGARLLGVALLILGGVLSVAALFVRYRGGNVILRAQLRWIVLAAGLTAAAAFPFLVTRYLIRVPEGIGELFAAGAQIGSVSFPAATAMAMSRNRLFDIDVLLGRTLVYVPLMAVLGGLYTASIALFQRLFIAMTGGTSDMALILTVLVVAAAFTPVRKALEGLVERRFALPSTARAPARTTPAPEPTHPRTIAPRRQGQVRRPEPGPWRLLNVSNEGRIDCPLRGSRDRVDCLRCDWLRAIIRGDGREAVVCAAAEREPSGVG
jgi:hypothetical protein